MHPLPSSLTRLRRGAFAGVAILALAACGSTGEVRTSVSAPDFSGMTRTEASSNLGVLAARYKKDPKDKATIIYYAGALRASGQAEQAAAVLETGMAQHPQDLDIRIAYAKALSAGGRFDQALTVLDDTIRPEQPDWNALLVKGAVLDQMGRNADARQVYAQALTIAPEQASIEANLGLSYAMTHELDSAEAHLRKAVQMRGATSKIRQNLALVVGLQGRFDESRAMFSEELAPDQVEANMTYIRSMLTQQNRWQVIEGGQQG